MLRSYKCTEPQKGHDDGKNKRLHSLKNVFRSPKKPHGFMGLFAFIKRLVHKKYFIKIIIKIFILIFTQLYVIYNGFECSSTKQGP